MIISSCCCAAKAFSKFCEKRPAQGRQTRIIECGYTLFDKDKVISLFFTQRGRTSEQCITFLNFKLTHRPAIRLNAKFTARKITGNFHKNTHVCPLAKGKRWGVIPSFERKFRLRISKCYLEVRLSVARVFTGEGFDLSVNAGLDAAFACGAFQMGNGE